MLKNRHILGILGFLLSTSSTFACINDSYTYGGESLWVRAYSSVFWYYVAIHITLLLIYIIIIRNILRSNKELIDKKEYKQVIQKYSALGLGILILFAAGFSHYLFLIFAFYGLYYLFKQYAHSIVDYVTEVGKTSKSKVWTVYGLHLLYILLIVLGIVLGKMLGGQDIVLFIVLVIIFYPLFLVYHAMKVIKNNKFKITSFNVLFFAAWLAFDTFISLALW